jgi:hypothetical protein
MRHIDEDTITQAVIARHATAADTRLRDVMTSLVQHLHAFAREVKLTEAEWDAGSFAAEVCRDGGRRPRWAAVRRAGLSTLVRRSTPRVARNPARPVRWVCVRTPRVAGGRVLLVRGRVTRRRPADRRRGGADRGAPARHHAGGDATAPRALRRGGRTRFRTTAVAACRAGPPPVAAGAPAFPIAAPGYERLVTQVFPARYPDSTPCSACAAAGGRVGITGWGTRLTATPGAVTTLDFSFFSRQHHIGDKP